MKVWIGHTVEDAEENTDFKYMKYMFLRNNLASKSVKKNIQ